MIRISINLEFGDGDFERGFTRNQVTVTVATSESKITLNEAQLPPSPEIPKLYEGWKQQYYSILSNNPHRGFKNRPNKVSSQDCAKQAKALRRQLHEWLQPIKLELEPVLQQYGDGEIYLVIHTQKVREPLTLDTLHRLPWQEWELFLPNISSGNDSNNSITNYTGEVALCFNSDQTKVAVYLDNRQIRRVRIISIFGDSEGIDTNADQNLLSKLKKRGAELIFLTKPKRAEFNILWEEPCDILFFAGHSNTEADGSGVININPDESLSFAEIKRTVGAAIEKGLQLAIFNSCDGLGLARELAFLNLPYIIVWREVVPDIIAQKFIEYFLSCFTSGKSLFASFSEARVRLFELAESQYTEKQLPGISWLPIIIQNTIELPPTWKDFGGLTGELPNNPYRGLSAFREEDAKFYFGRENFIADLIEAVYTRPLVPIIGASGSGKSSLVFAGLVPSLRKKGDVGIVSFRPENKPFDNLAVALTSQETPLLRGEGRKSEVDHRLAQINLDLNWRHDETKLYDYIQTIILALGYRRLVLICDQFEELYTLTPEVEQQSFLKALYFAVKDTPNITLVLTLRADFLGIVLNSSMSKALQQYTPLFLAPMESQELRDAIEKPAALMKVELQSGLTDKLIHDLGNHCNRSGGRLPLLEFALTQLWTQQENFELTHQAYQEIGGLEKALAKYADLVLDELQLENLINRYKVEKIFIQLVSPGAGTEDTRRVATRTEVGFKNWNLVQKLATKRLLVTGRDETNGVEIVEIVHEALIREWGTFRRCIENNREFRTWQERLKQDARSWEQNQRNPSSLLHGTPLSVAEDWYKQRSDELTRTEQDYITASIGRRDKEQQQQRFRRNLIILGSVVAFIVISFFAGISEIGRTNAEASRLSITSEKYFNVNDSETAVTNGIKAGKFIKNSIWQPWIESGTRMQVVSNLQQVIYNFKVRTLKGHTEGVASVIFSPDGKTVASASHDKTVKLWDATNGREIFTLKGHTEGVASVTFSPDGKTVASASHDKTVKLWDATNGKEIFTLKRHTEGVASVTFSKDGKTVASASHDKTVKLWDATNGREIFTLEGIRRITFSPDGKTLASASEDKTVKLWNAANGREIFTLKGHTGWVTNVAFSPDGKTVASGSEDNTVKLWDATNGREIFTLKGYTKGVTNVTFSPDGKKVAASASDFKDTIKLWDTTNGREIFTFIGHTSWVRSVIFSSNYRYQLASASDDKTVKLWDITNGREINTFKGHTDRVTSVTFSPDGRTLASASDDKTVKLWDVTDGKEIFTLEEHTDAVKSLTFSPDGRTLASTSDDTTVKLWDAINGREIYTFKGHTNLLWNVVFSPDGKTLASASSDKTVKLWDATNGREIYTLKGHTGIVESVVFSPDGKTLASASSDKTVKLWDATNGREIYTLKGHTNQVTSAIFSPDGKTLASASSDKTVKLWNATNGREIYTLKGHTNQVTSAIFSPDGKTLASASFDKTVKLWNAANGREIYTLKGHTGIVERVTFSPDGKTVASTSNDNTVKLWNASNGREIYTLKGHTGIVGRVTFSPDGKTIVSASEDKTVKLWDASNGREIYTLKGHTYGAGHVVFSPDGKTLASGSLGTIILWNLDLDKLLVRGCRLIGNYLKSSPDVIREDRNLCDGIKS